MGVPRTRAAKLLVVPIALAMLDATHRSHGRPLSWRVRLRRTRILAVLVFAAGCQSGTHAIVKTPADISTIVARSDCVGFFTDTPEPGMTGIGECLFGKDYLRIITFTSNAYRDRWLRRASESGGHFAHHLIGERWIVETQEPLAESVYILRGRLGGSIA